MPHARPPLGRHGNRAEAKRAAGEGGHWLWTRERPKQAGIRCRGHPYRQPAPEGGPRSVPTRDACIQLGKAAGGRAEGQAACAQPCPPGGPQSVPPQRSPLAGPEAPSPSTAQK